jgi:hypothetical protein
MGGARVYKVGHTYNGSELAEIDFEQTADTMYLAHIDHAPGKLVRQAHTSWEFSDVTFGPSLVAPTGCSVSPSIGNVDSENDGVNYFPQPATYCVTAVNDDTGEESRASNEAGATNDLTLKKNYNTVSWGAVTGATRYNVYKAENSQFFGYIGTTDGLTFRDDNIGPALDKAPPQAFNPFTGAGDYPSTVTLFEQRGMWARTKNIPHGVWGTRSGQLENMDRSQPLRADDSVAFTIIAGRVNSVNQLVTTTSLIALTSDSVFNIDGDGSGGVLDATTPPATRRQVGRGSSRLPPLVVDNVVFYSPSIGQAVRTLGFDFAIDGLKSNDVTIFSPHFFEGLDIKSWCFAQEPRSVIWAARSDGKLLCFTWEQEQNVWGWTLCETDGDVESVCSITEHGEDRVYMIVAREVNGVTRKFVERLASHRWESVETSVFMDCAVSAVVETPKSTFTGLWHLEGRTDVVGLCDGHVLTGLTVSNGSVTLPTDFGTASTVSFGIPYTVEVETLPVRMNTQGAGWNLGRSQGLGEVVLTLADSRNVKAGINEDNLFILKSRTSERYGYPDELMNGEWTVNMANKAAENVSVLIRQTDPLPFTLLGVALDPAVNG